MAIDYVESFKFGADGERVYIPNKYDALNMPYINDIFIRPQTGNDNNNGTDKDTDCVKTMDRAFQIAIDRGLSTPHFYLMEGGDYVVHNLKTVTGMTIHFHTRDTAKSTPTNLIFINDNLSGGGNNYGNEQLYNYVAFYNCHLNFGSGTDKYAELNIYFRSDYNFSYFENSVVTFHQCNIYMQKLDGTARGYGNNKEWQINFIGGALVCDRVRFNCPVRVKDGKAELNNVMIRVIYDYDFMLSAVNAEISISTPMINGKPWYQLAEFNHEGTIYFNSNKPHAEMEFANIKSMMRFEPNCCVSFNNTSVSVAGLGGTRNSQRHFERFISLNYSTLYSPKGTVQDLNKYDTKRTNPLDITTSSYNVQSHSTVNGYYLYAQLAPTDVIFGGSNGQPV